jgi:Serine/threonine protein kinase
MDKFHIIHTLNTSSYSDVYLVEEKESHEQFALKEVYEPKLILNSVELDLMQRIYHPNIIKPIEFFFTYKEESKKKLPKVKSINYVLPLAQSTLEEVIKHEVSYEKKMQYLREIASALFFLHQAGVYHCDIKPQNILIIDGHAVLTDLGIAKYKEAIRINICQTKEWASPETFLTLDYDVPKSLIKKH